MRFSNFVKDVHPDIDHLFSKSLDDAWPEIARLADQYYAAIGKTHCVVCGKKKRLKRISKCDACFTTNA